MQSPETQPGQRALVPPNPGDNQSSPSSAGERINLLRLRAKIALLTAGCALVCLGIFLRLLSTNNNHVGVLAIKGTLGPLQMALIFGVVLVAIGLSSLLRIWRHLVLLGHE
jgi:uncharacterized membrane protein YidH (DUF202 family)